MTRDEILQLLDTTRLGLDGEFHSTGYNVGIGDDQTEGQTVLDLHFNLALRYTDDWVDARNGARWMFPENVAYWSKQ